MEKTSYPGFWSIDRRIPIAVYRVPVLDVNNLDNDNKQRFYRGHNRQHQSAFGQRAAPAGKCKR